MYGKYLYPLLPTTSVTAVRDAISLFLPSRSLWVFDTGDHWLVVTRKKSRGRSWLDHKCNLFLSRRPLTPTIRARDNLRQVENLIEQEATVVTKNFEVQNAYQKCYLTLYPPPQLTTIWYCCSSVCVLLPFWVLAASCFAVTNCNINLTCWRHFAATYLRRN